MRGMKDIPKGMRVRLRLLYNGYIYPAFGVRDERDGDIVIVIPTSQLPRGWIAERGTGIDLIPNHGEVVPDDSGRDGWVMPEVFDLDSFLRKTD